MVSLACCVDKKKSFAAQPVVKKLGCEQIFSMTVKCTEGNTG